MRTPQPEWMAGFDEPPPPLTPAGEMALQCWAFCDGWRPERWPVYDALYPVPDWHHHTELLRVIRNTMHAIKNAPP